MFIHKHSSRERLIAKIGINELFRAFGTVLVSEQNHRCAATALAREMETASPRQWCEVRDYKGAT